MGGISRERSRGGGEALLLPFLRPIGECLRRAGDLLLDLDRSLRGCLRLSLYDLLGDLEWRRLGGDRLRDRLRDLRRVGDSS